ncbi:Hypothetical protein A7982_11379 [Minicystis rosea]|nr:Hypothetical protein A7982_11379 [Minicystis rosea]
MNPNRSSTSPTPSSSCSLPREKRRLVLDPQRRAFTKAQDEGALRALPTVPCADAHPHERCGAHRVSLALARRLTCAVSAASIDVEHDSASRRAARQSSFGWDARGALKRTSQSSSSSAAVQS